MKLETQTGWCVCARNEDEFEVASVGFPAHPTLPAGNYGVLPVRTDTRVADSLCDLCSNAPGSRVYGVLLGRTCIVVLLRTQYEVSVLRMYQV
jgi:hypothetical protein